jgi:biopolymer transport protein ExbD
MERFTSSTRRALAVGVVLVVAAGFVAGRCLHLPKEGDRAAAIEHCRASIDAFPADAGTYSVWAVMRECAGMIRDDQCRNAVERAAGSDGVMSWSIALSGCRATYCRPEAGVTLCDRTEFATREEEARAGAELIIAIFAREGGSKGPALVSAIRNVKGRLPPVPLTLAAEPLSASEWQVRISNEDPVMLLDGDGGVLATLAVSKLPAFLVSKPELVRGKVSLLADSSVDHQRVIAVLDALKQVGVNRIAFGVRR